MDGTGSFVATGPRQNSIRGNAMRRSRGHRASTRVRLAALIGAAAAVLGGCTTNGSGVQTQDLSTAPSSTSATPAGTFASVSAGISGTCGVKTDGTVQCWGSQIRPPQD